MKRRLIAGTINYYEPEPGWQNVHLDKSERLLYRKGAPNLPPEIVCDLTELVAAEPEVYDEIRCWQVLEHLRPADATVALAGFNRVLRPGGVLDLEVPDLDGIARAWGGGEFTHDELLMAIYGDQAEMPDAELNQHRWGWTAERLSRALAEAGLVCAEGNIGEGLQLRYRAVKP